ncbi:glucokinase [Saitoella coloradoensis]
MTLLEEAQRVADEFEFTSEQLKTAVVEFRRCMDLGLKNNDEAMTMIPTFVSDVPNGTEKGTFLALDIGGTNLRVCSIHLQGDGTFHLVQSKSAIPKAMMIGSSHDLFAFIAERIESFIREHHEDKFDCTEPEHMLQLGFTFSFPVNQTAVNKGVVLRWTKGFNIPDAVGVDVVDLLQRAIDAKSLPVKVAALVNDTVGALMARAYAAPKGTETLIGAIFGTGTNGAYVENMENVHKLEKAEHQTPTMVINTEWGAFDNAMRVLPATPYDNALDHASVNPGYQMYEKRISGMFLGEIFRQAIISLTTASDPGMGGASLFNGEASKQLNLPFSLDTSVLSAISEDESPDLATVKKVVQEQLGVSAGLEATETLQAVQLVSRAIGRRAARLSAIALCAIISASARLSSANPTAKVDIGVDGSVVEFYPNFELMIREAMREVLGEEKEGRVTFGLAKDGSGVGAALCALMARKQQEMGIKYSADELLQEKAQA